MIRLLTGDCRAVLPTLSAASVQCVVTSPPYYGLRDYGVVGQLGLEATPDQYVATMVDVFREVRRVLRDDGTCWVNVGDSYSTGNSGQRVRDTCGGFQLGLDTRTQGAALANPGRVPTEGLATKQLLMMPARLALALQADGWWLRSDIIWAKPNPMPESVVDRPTNAHEHVFLLAKSARYFYDAEAVREPFVDDRNGNPGSYDRTSQAAKGANRDRADTGFLNNGNGWNANGHATGRNARNVWTIATAPFPDAHFATFPPELAERCIKAGTKPGDMVLDPFGGAGTTGLVADRLQRDAILIELSPAFVAMAKARLTDDAPLLAEVAD